MTEMQASIGRIQLRKLPDWLAARRRNADILTRHLRNIPALRITTPSKDIKHAYYKYYTLVRPELLAPGWDRDSIIKAISAEGVPCFSGTCSEIYMEKAFETHGFRIDKRLPVAKELGETSLMFQVHPTLVESDMEDTVNAMKKVMAIAGKNK
jgi:dTDP-4-amino-4,6-dideoxygalactose transaminase